MLGASTPGRVAIAAGIVALAGLVGLLAGRGTGDDGGAAEPASELTAVASPDPQRSLGRELETLADTRTNELGQLRKAQKPGEQARVGRALARAYLQSATAVARTDRLTGLTRGGEPIANALRRAAAAYRRLAVGAARDRRSVYNAAREAVRRAEVLLARRLRANLDAGGSE